MAFSIKLSKLGNKSHGPDVCVKGTIIINQYEPVQSFHDPLSVVLHEYDFFLALPPLILVCPTRLTSQSSMLESKQKSQNGKVVEGGGGLRKLRVGGGGISLVILLCKFEKK